MIMTRKYDQIYMDMLASEFPGYRLNQILAAHNMNAVNNRQLVGYGIYIVNIRRRNTAMDGS